MSVYGGSHGTFQPAAEYGGRTGNFSYYVTGDYKQNDLGIESPDGSRDPLHDHTTQAHGFAYFEDILDPANRLSLILGISDEHVSDSESARACSRRSATTSAGTTEYLSDNLNENQHELTEYAILSLAALARAPWTGRRRSRRATPA